METRAEIPQKVTEEKLPRIQVEIASGEKAKARNLLAAIRMLKTIEQEERPASDKEKQVLGKYAGFGSVALSIFPASATRKFKDASWKALGDKLQEVLTAEEYESVKRTTFNAFYTSPVVMEAIVNITAHLGVPDDALILEPGCGIGNFMRHAPDKSRFIGIEMDSITGRIAKLLYPEHDIRIENFRNTVLPENSVDCVIGNVPFADIKLEHRGNRFSLHDYFFARSIDALKPSGILALVTSRFTLDKQNGSIREYLAARADFIGAIRLPSDAFKREGTEVVTDIVILRKRAGGRPDNHQFAEWLTTSPLKIGTLDMPVNRYFHAHPEMILGELSASSSLYGEGFKVESKGQLRDRLSSAIQTLPQFPVFAATESFTFQSTKQTTSPTEHLSEGSFLTAEDGTICQRKSGQNVPVVYGGTKLRALGSLTGRRLAALIRIRDKARHVLRTQNEGWPEPDKEEARQSLNFAYDQFQSKYGPVNKTTFSKSREGNVIRRMPNLAKFREDPDAMLVMSLEEYDEVTGKASKTAIMIKDVVGKTPEILQVQTAEEGLLVSLNRWGRVDLKFIESLYGKPETQIVSELGNLIYHDPRSNNWQTADEYLSGNVRSKLLEAENAGPEYLRNVEALREVQPEDVLPGEIDANLGAPWIPVADIRAFAGFLFQVPPSTITISHLGSDAVWTVEAGYQAMQSVAAISDFGTDRANGVWLLELSLNIKTPVIYDVVLKEGQEVKEVNHPATFAAKEKQRLIKEKFRNWVFSDPDRSERLVRIYNDTFNNLRPRVFDGMHLDFPGMNQTIRLHKHQKDAVWRGMSSGNTLLAHVVGAGKTFTMAAIGMKLKQAGLIRKPMYVVPNHLLEQFAREFMQLYPNASLLVTAKEDLARDRRKFLTAKIASREWDGIIVTHSTFERIGMSSGFQETFLLDQIGEYDKLLQEHAANRRSSRNIIKTIEKQKAARAERLKSLLAKDKKDDGLVFDEIGVDHLFVDEAQYYKNLETPTKMERVAGIQTGGSERAYDLFMKTQYLHTKHPGHGVTFATGTPISNTMVEMYTMQRFLDPTNLHSRGLHHFDAWAATFGEVIDTMEISPDGSSLRPRSRFARFINLPELQQLFRSFSDVQTADMLDLRRPRLATGKPVIVSAPMSVEQQFLQRELIERYEKLRSQKVDPRVDNALNITTDGRKLAIDARMLSAGAADYSESKVNLLVNNVVQVWQSTKETKRTQMIFCDLGVHPLAWGYSVYGDILRKLQKQGIPKEEIACIGDADSDAKKQSLFERVRNGVVRVLIGSTQKMGTGTNVQKRLAVLHHLDAPWKPAEVEQREGRILRQGNENEEVTIYRYVTEGSFDAYMWQALETKARFISQIMTGKNTLRSAQDFAGQELSYAEVKAIASGNPAVLLIAEADAEVQKVSLLRKNHLDEQFVARRNVRELPDKIARLSARLTGLTTDKATIDAHPSGAILLEGQAFVEQRAIELLGRKWNSFQGLAKTAKHQLGSYRGLAFGIQFDPPFPAVVYLEGKSEQQTKLAKEHSGPRAVLNAVARITEEMDGRIVQLTQELEVAQSQLRNFQERVGKSFLQEEYLKELIQLRDQLKKAISVTTTDAPSKDGENIDTNAITSKLRELLTCK